MKSRIFAALIGGTLMAAALAAPAGAVTGGTPVESRTTPWIVALYGNHFPGGNRPYLCAGALLDAQWVATDQHCILNLAPIQIQVAAGQDSVGVGAPRYDIDSRVTDPQSSLVLLHLTTPVERATAVPIATSPVTANTSARAYSYSTDSVTEQPLMTVTETNVGPCLGLASILCGQATDGSFSHDAGAPLVIDSPTGPMLAGVLTDDSGMFRAMASSLSFLQTTMGALPSVPGTPTNFTVTQTASWGDFMLRWTPASTGGTPVAFTVDISHEYLENGVWSQTLTAKRDIDPAMTSARIVLPSTLWPVRYTFAIHARNIVGASLLSPAIGPFTTTVATVPSPPRSPKITVLPSKMTVHWDAPADGGSGGVIAYDVYSATGERAGYISPTERSVDLPNKVVDKAVPALGATVIAISAAGASAPTMAPPVAVKTGTAPPPAPTSDVDPAPMSGIGSVTWATPPRDGSDYTGWEVRWVAIDAGTRKPGAIMVQHIGPLERTAHASLDAGEYDVRVRGVSKLGPGSSAPPLVVTVQGKAAPLPPTPALAASLPEASKSTTTAKVMASLAAPVTADTTVPWTTLAGTAAAGVDFKAASGNVVFTKKRMSVEIAVTVISDKVKEGDEYFDVVLSPPPGVTLKANILRVLIRNDD